MNDLQIDKLAQKIENLINLCAELYQENTALKAAETEWLKEREELVNKTEFARSRVEEMIARLKTLEQESEQ